VCSSDLPFFEAGWGGYNSYNSFSGADVKGEGNISYYGGGLLARYDFPFGLYVEGSGRIGGVRTEYSSSDLRDVNNRKAEYDISTPYYGAHAGLGYIWNFTDKASVDLYANYLWNRQEGDSALLAGDPIEFKEMESHRIRFGGRLTYAVNDYISPYFGAAYEHEFDGRAGATVYGNKIATPDLIGGTGIGELGLTLKPSKDLPLSFDLGVQGYVGKREGVTGSLQVRFEF
jgi:outer membrane autotransporter protein